MKHLNNNSYLMIVLVVTIYLFILTVQYILIETDINNDHNKIERVSSLTDYIIKDSVKTKLQKRRVKHFKKLDKLEKVLNTNGLVKLYVNYERYR